MSEDRNRPVVIVSNDTHIGPRLVEDLRPYCPKEHLDEFDRFTEAAAADKEAAWQMLQGSGHLDHPNFRTPGTTTLRHVSPTTTMTASPPG